MQQNYVTLEAFRRGVVEISPQHLQNLKEIIGKGIRADWKKRRLARLDLSLLRLRPPHWSFPRILFYADGHVVYVAGQDYDSEIKEVQDAILGKKPR